MRLFSHRVALALWASPALSACSAGGLQVAETSASTLSNVGADSHPVYATCPGPLAAAESTHTDLNPPTWSWSGCAGADGGYRVCLDDAACAPMETTATSYTPAAALRVGTHQLFVSQQDAAGEWSPATPLSMRVLPRRLLGMPAGQPSDEGAANTYGYPTLAGAEVESARLELAGGLGFVKGDVAQGGLGDCYFAASVAAITFADPNYLLGLVGTATDALGNSLVDANDYALYQVTMPYADLAGATHPWVLLTDAQLPRVGDSVAYAQPTRDGAMVKIGVPILEKAFAALDQDTDYLQQVNPGSYQDADGYRAIGEGGWAASAFGALAGSSGQTLPMSQVSAVQLEAILPGGGVAAAADINSGWSPVPSQLPSGASMSLSGGGIWTYTPAGGGSPLQLPNVHYYSFMGSAGGMSTWRNPWGGDNAEATLPVADARAIFNRFTSVTLPQRPPVNASVAPRP